MMFCFNKKLKIKNKEKESLTGFTILELIVAIFVMTVGVLGAYAVVQQIIVYNSISSSRLTAAYLAQEGIELVRNIRDTNWLTVPSVAWNNGLGAGDYEADWNDETLTSYSDRFLDFVTDEYFYEPSSSNNTKFKRKITIFDEALNMFNVKVEVLWTEKGNDYTVAVEEYLYNWR